MAIGSAPTTPVAADYDAAREAVSVTLEVRAVEGARVVLASAGGLVRPRDRRADSLRRLLHHAIVGDGVVGGNTYQCQVGAENAAFPGLPGPPAGPVTSFP